MQKEYSALSVGLRLSDLELMAEVFSRFSEVEKCVLFGSRAKGTYRNGSDVDVALFGGNISHTIARDISFGLNEESPLPYHFDIVVYNQITNADLKEHIDRVGVIIYARQ